MHDADLEVAYAPPVRQVVREGWATRLTEA